MIIYVLAIGVPVALFAAVCALIVWTLNRDDGNGTHTIARGPKVTARKSPPRLRRTVYVPVPERHHDWYLQEKPGNLAAAFLPAPPAEDLVPGAGLSSFLPVTTATCPGEETPKVDSPAPETPAAARNQPPAPAPPPVSPITAARNAADAIATMPTGDYLGHLEDATAWEARAPMAALLSDDTLARGIPAVK